jgi:2-oxoglutarate ferredoxin oxidoreductase subunit gamma
MIETPLKRDDLDAVNIDASEIARCLGNVRVANVVALGAFIEATKILRSESIEESISDLFSSKKVSLVDINLKALAQGAANCKVQTCSPAK